jgi:hypothetical protein
METKAVRREPVFVKSSQHYNILRFVNPIMPLLRDSFEIDCMNFLMFSTSGVHGSYSTIEDIERSLGKKDEEREDLTILLVQPRTVTLTYGVIDAAEITPDDIPLLKRLRAESFKVMLTIGIDK